MAASSISLLTDVDQVAITRCRARAQPAKPRPANPISIIAHVETSGTAPTPSLLIPGLNRSWSSGLLLTGSK